MGLLLRSALFDFIHFKNFLLKSTKTIIDDGDEKEVLDIDILDQLVDTYKKTHLNFVPDDYKSKLSENLKDKLNITEEDLGKKHKEVSIYGKIRPNAVNEGINFLIYAIDCWEWYSKYEHYGVFTGEMVSQIEENRSRRENSIVFLYIAFYSYLLLLSDYNVKGISLENIETLKKFFM